MRVEWTPGFVLVLGLNCYLFGFGVPAAFLAAAVLHELGHLICARALGIPVRCLRVSALGGELSLAVGRQTAYWQDLLLAISGPAANFLALGVLLFLLPPDPGAVGAYLLSANFLLGAFNLMPVPPLDGGTVLRAGAAMLLPPAAAQRLTTAVAAAAVGGILILGSWIALGEGHNLSLLLLGLWLAAALVRRR